MRLVISVAILVATLIVPTVSGQQQDSLEVRVQRLEQHQAAFNSGAVAFLFGAFCALWAQNTGRSAWQWFFLGLFFSVFTVIVLLSKNSTDRARAQRSTPTALA
jgi:hypothetical protein